MNLLASLAIAIQTTTTGHAALARGEPHPAVVRVIAPESDGVSYGSGALVATNGEHGLVVTNWHVVRHATGQIVVAFADGFRSGATVMATDTDWDLAALAIWRPGVEPIPLSREAPRPGEPLTIAGYGSGRYRTITGRCTQYVAPGGDQPFEMVELSAAARQGDSGGPIFNRRGELAGVLFGSSLGCTTGSYCGRVRWFLARVTEQFREMPRASTMLAASPNLEPPNDDRWAPTGHAPLDPPTSTATPVTAAIGARRPPADQRAASDATGGVTTSESADVSTDGWAAAPPSPNTQAGFGRGTVPFSLRENRDSPPVRPEDSPPVPRTPTRLDQIKTILAAVGMVAFLFHGLRLLGKAQGI